MMYKKRFSILALQYILTVLIIFLFAASFFHWVLNGFSEPKFFFTDESRISRNSIFVSKNNSKIFLPYLINQLSFDDKSKLIDIKHFKFIINHNVCYNRKPFLLILIHSAPANLKKRNVIRETWGQAISTITTLFLVGISEKYKLLLEKEDRDYEDLIQGNFEDVYRNITYKHVMALKWVTYYCPNAQYILKLDDDVFVHVSALIEFLRKELLPWGASRLILCNAILVSKVKRSWRSKWHVSPKEYSSKEYPSYCAGWAILYSPDVVFLLYQEAQKEPYFWIDDVHITGTLAKKINLTHKSIHSMILTESMMKLLLEKSNLNKKFLFGPPSLIESKIRALYNVVTTNEIKN